MKGYKIHAYSSKNFYWVPNLWQAGNAVGLKDTVGSAPPKSLYSNENRVKIKIKDHFTKWEALRWCDCEVATGSGATYNAESGKTFLRSWHYLSWNLDHSWY